MKKIFLIICFLPLISCSTKKTQTYPDGTYVDESTLIMFEKNSTELTAFSEKRLEKSFKVMDTTQHFFEKFQLIIMPSTCKEELEYDKFVGVKRCAVIYQLISNRFNKKLY